MPKFLISALLLLASLALQFFAASLGYSFDLALAALIAFAFILDFAELLPLVALAVLIINWQPAVSGAILVYALFPLAFYGLRKVFPWEPWVAIPVVAVLGAIALGLATGAAYAGALLADAALMALFASFSFWMVKENLF
jgi:hypothetical protein